LKEGEKKKRNERGNKHIPGLVNDRERESVFLVDKHPVWEKECYLFNVPLFVQKKKNLSLPGRGGQKI